MSRFASAGHLAAWAGVAPGNYESAGKRQSGKVRQGNRALRVALVQAAHALSPICWRPSFLRLIRPHPDSLVRGVLADPTYRRAERHPEPVEGSSQRMRGCASHSPFSSQVKRPPLIELSSRRVVHLGVTRQPSEAWVAQQLREATPFGERPKYFIRDNEAKFGTRFDGLARGTGVEVLKSPYRAPRANAICERFRGSVRRECLDHLLKKVNKLLRYSHLVFIIGCYPDANSFSSTLRKGRSLE